MRLSLFLCLCVLSMPLGATGAKADEDTCASAMRHYPVQMSSQQIKFAYCQWQPRARGCDLVRATPRPETTTALICDPRPQTAEQGDLCPAISGDRQCASS